MDAWCCFCCKIGYSFGGSIAQIVFLKLLIYFPNYLSDYLKPESNKRESLRCVTFGSPSFVNFNHMKPLIAKSVDLEKFLDHNLGQHSISNSCCRALDHSNWEFEIQLKCFRFSVAKHHCWRWRNSTSYYSYRKFETKIFGQAEIIKDGLKAWYVNKILKSFILPDPNIVFSVAQC